MAFQCIRVWNLSKECYHVGLNLNVKSHSNGKITNYIYNFAKS